MNSQEFQISIVTDISEMYQFYPEVTLFYVLDGTLRITVNEVGYQLENEDIMLVDIGVRNCSIVAENTMICQLSFDNELISRVVENQNGTFFCNTVVDTDHSYEELRTIMRKIVYQQAIPTHKTQSYEVSLCYQLLDVLVESFMNETENADHVEKSVALKLNGILKYVHQNYQSHMNLSDLADQMYVSTSTLSRLFKKETGIYFAEYVNQVRLKYAVKELKCADSNITRIAMNCGFSSASAMNRVFRDVYQISPTEYREKWEAEKVQIETRTLQLKTQLVEEIKQNGLNEDARMDAQQISVVVDVGETTTMKKTWNKAINVGAVNRLGEVNIQFQILNLVKELGFTHVRVWNIFSKHLMITDGKTIGHYNYDKIDMIFDFLVNNHIYAFIDFGRRPDTALKTEGITLYYEEEYIEFESKKIWEAMVQDLLHHLALRYGEEIQNWIFELAYSSYDENHCYNATEFDYNATFQSFYQAVKTEFRDAEVGGYSANLGEKTEYIERFLTSCKLNHCIPDFFSYMLFPYKRVEGEDKKTFYKRNPVKNMEMKYIEKFQALLKKMEMTHSKIYITEWNSSLSNRNYLNDSCFRSAYFVKKISEIRDSVDMICFWFATDWISTYYDTRSIVNGAAGIITKDNIKKPIWHAFSFLNELGDVVIAIGENYVITKKSEKSFVIICVNFKWLACNYFFLDENEVSLSRFKELFENSDKLKLNICLQQLEEDGEYIVKKRQVNSEHGCILTEWIKMGADEDLERADVKYIQEMSVPYMEREKVIVKNGRLDLKIEMRDQEIALLHVYKK